MSRVYRKVLLGMGFDCRDGHVRVTRGSNFRLVGGSETTHGEMQEKAIKFNEQLNKRKKNLDQISEEEFREISKKVGLKIAGEK